MRFISSKPLMHAGLIVHCKVHLLEQPPEHMAHVFLLLFFQQSCASLERTIAEKQSQIGALEERVEHEAEEFQREMQKVIEEKEAEIERVEDDALRKNQENREELFKKCLNKDFVSMHFSKDSTTGVY